jgi:hypothetical protein
MFVVFDKFILVSALAVENLHLILDIFEDTLRLTHGHLITFDSLLLKVNLLEPSLEQLYLRLLLLHNQR